MTDTTIGNTPNDLLSLLTQEEALGLIESLREELTEMSEQRDGYREALNNATQTALYLAGDPYIVAEYGLTPTEVLSIALAEAAAEKDLTN